MVFCIVVLAVTHALKSTLATFKRPKVAARLVTTTILISINWLVYVWATNNGHVVEASLGYYINPLMPDGNRFAGLENFGFIFKR